MAITSHEDPASIADAVAYFLTSTANASVGSEPWEVEALDIGEVEITTHHGQVFRLTIEDVTEEYR
jgi:hypothetical protein